MSIYDCISPELVSLLPILYVTGTLLKKSSVRDWLIPFILGIIGVVLGCAWTAASSELHSVSDVFTCLASGTVQGVLCAASTVYAHNLVKQYGKKDDGNDKETYA